MQHNLSLGEQVTLQGILTAADWDVDDQIAAVKIATADEEENLVEKFQGFVPHVRKSIRATGILDRSKRRILVQSYELSAI